MELEILTERQLASRTKSKNYIPPEERIPEIVQELRKARQEIRKENSVKRQIVLEARRRAEFERLEEEIFNVINKNNKNSKYSKSHKVVSNMELLMNFILENPQILVLLSEFEEELISYLVNTRNRINMVLKLHNKNQRTYKQRKELKRPFWVRRPWIID